MPDPKVAMKKEGLDELTRRDHTSAPPKASEYKDKICNG